MGRKHNENCYCEACCANACEWWEWRSEDDVNASGPRYWTKKHALLDKDDAVADGLPRLWHVLDGGATYTEEASRA